MQPWTIKAIIYARKIDTRSARIRALFGVPMPTAISLTPDESNLALDSFKVEASSQLEQEQATVNSPKISNLQICK